MADDQGEKTEEPTQQRRDDFRKRGQVTQTKELATVFLLFGSALAMMALGRYFLHNMIELFSFTFSDFVAQVARGENMATIFSYMLEMTFKLVAPLFGLFWVLAFASNTVQVGFLINEEALQFKIEKLNPLEGLKRLFSARSVVEGIKAVLKVSVVIAIVYLIIKSEIHVISALVDFSIPQLMTYVSELTIKLIFGVGLFMTALAGFDYFFQRFDLEKKMRMTKQEVKEEMKSREGDPLIKSRIRRVQREMANKRMMEDVPKADVIITNPTHIAVAIKYDSTDVAPTLVAKGAELIAENIKKVAKEHNIPIIENKPLARTIYKTLKIGQAIPRELYTAVAEVLSFIFKLKRKRNQ
ncbi:MAG: flagellar biosynthesis protein FlhB [Bdellovibrionaceae bacterium]|jgi:flagellar biosynthesis protein FlhB|nr:flagellar biosynthesis protein FlhB [Pseudobdellovibrionaceae bacterium]